jgi:hypothetical protein
VCPICDTPLHTYEETYEPPIETMKRLFASEIKAAEKKEKEGAP